MIGRMESTARLAFRSCRGHKSLTHTKDRREPGSKSVGLEMNWVEILVYAGLAVFFLFQLYRVLGRNTGHMGAEPPLSSAPELALSPNGPGPMNVEPAPSFTGPAGYKLRKIYEQDQAFDPDHFLTGAKLAYEMIVRAFESGDKEVLRNLLEPDVAQIYSDAIDARQTSQDGPRSRFVRLKHAELMDAEIIEGRARITVRFEAELTVEEQSNRSTVEDWVFQRPLNSQSPNWRLASVEIG